MAYISKIAIGNSTYDLKGYPTLIPCAYCNTAAATAAKTAVCTDYTLTSKTYLHVLIKTANSSSGKITLNVNGKGAKDIWINGAVSSASNYTLPAGSYIAYYDGSKYLFRTDGKLVTSDLIAGLGTAAVKDVPSSGDASSTQVVMGNDSRLTDSRTPKSHTHGNIQNDGTLQSSDITIANGDKLIVTDASDSNKVARTSISFDGSTTSQALSKKGTWASFLPSSGGTVSGNVLIRKTSVQTDPDTDDPAQLMLRATYTPTGGSAINSSATIRAYSDRGAGNGSNLVIQPGGNLFIGSGESPEAHYALYKNSGTERTFITADSDINIQAGGNNPIGNRKGLKIQTDGSVVPNVADNATTNSGSIGTSDYKWANIYATSLNGVTIGDSPKFTDTNTKVTQTNDTSNNKSYRVLFSNSNDNTTKDDTARKNPYLLYNPSGNLLQVGDDSHYGYVTSTYLTARNGLQAGTYVSIGDASSNIVVFEKDSGVSGSVTVTSPTVSGKLAITDDTKLKKIGTFSDITGHKLVTKSGATEIQFVVKMPVAISEKADINMVLTIPTEAVTRSDAGNKNPGNYQSLRQGYYYASTAFGTVCILVWLRTTDNYIYCKLNEVYQNSTTNQASSSSYEVYYR